MQWPRRWLDPLSASAGWVAVDFTNRPDSVYESVHQPRTRVFDPSSTLIGYGPWTLLGPGHVARLDRAGLAGLAELEELPGGHLLVSLGQDANEVPVERLRALGRQLAPVLAQPTRTAAQYLALDPREHAIIPYRI